MIWTTMSFWKLFSWRRLGVTLISVLGVFWTLIEIIDFCFKNEHIGDIIKEYWWVMILTVLLITIRQIWPKLTIKRKIKGKDVSISVRVGDIFGVARVCDLVIPFNTSFDTSLKDSVISPRSVQGQFTAKYYSDSTHLSADIEKADQYGRKIDFIAKKRGNPYRYPIGTVVKIDNPKLKGRIAYFTCIADMNENANASTNLGSIQDSLAKLWLFVTENGELSDLAIPVLGTGRGRITETREDMIFEIIDSFLISSQNKKVANSLTIFIHSGDLNNHELDFNRIREYLHYKTNFVRATIKEGDIGTAM